MGNWITDLEKRVNQSGNLEAMMMLNLMKAHAECAASKRRELQELGEAIPWHEDSARACRDAIVELMKEEPTDG